MRRRCLGMRNWKRPGAVVRVEGRIQAYSMGMWLNRSVFCVLLEVADRDMVGAGPFIFRGFYHRQTIDKGHGGSIPWMIPVSESGSPPPLVSSCGLLPNYL